METADCILTISSLCSLGVAISALIVSIISVHTAKKALEATKEATKASLDIATGNVLPKVLCMSQVNGRTEPCISIINVSPSTVVITSCGFCIDNAYFAVISPTYNKSCAIENKTSITSVTASELNCTLEPGHYCSLSLAIGGENRGTPLSAEDMNLILKNIGANNCYAFCAYSNHIEKSERPLSLSSNSLVNRFAFHRCTEDEIKTLTWWKPN